MDYTEFFSADVPAFFRSPTRDIFRNTDLSALISFAGGYPSPDTFPLEEIRDTVDEVLRTYGPRALQYGATEGIPELRRTLSERYGVPYENIRITTSSQQGIDVCTRILADPGDVILTAQPTYLGALQSFRAYRAEVIGIPHREDPEALAGAYRETIRQARASGKRVKFIYSIPDFQNPSGETLSLASRQALVKVAREESVILVEDSPYRELRYEGDSVATLYSLAPEQVLHLGSFSKILAPGFRLGWIFGPEPVLEQIGICKQALDLCPPVFDQYLAATLLRSGRLDRNLEQAVRLYRTKRDLMLECLEQEMPEGVRWTRPEGGLFLFVTFPENIDTVRLYGRALEAGVAYVAGSFFHTDGSGRNTMRLNFSFTDEGKIREGIRRLAALIRGSC